MFDPRQELSSLRTPTAEVRNMASHACITSLEMLESITLTCTWTKLYQFQNRNDIMMTWFRNSFSVFKKKHVREVQVCFLRVTRLSLAVLHIYLCRVLQSRMPRTTGESRRCSLHLETPVLILEQWQRMPIGYASIASCDQSYKSYMDIQSHGCYNMWSQQKMTPPEGNTSYSL